MTRSIPRLVGYATVGAGVAAAGYVGLITGACPVDLGVGRRVRPLGPQLVEVAAPRQVVFDVIAQPYLGRAPRALADKLRVLERGHDMVLAAHFTPLGGRLGLVAQTVETVRFTPPERVDFRLVRGPVPHVVEGPTCGCWGSAGVRWWRDAGNRRSPPPWPRSRPKPNGGRRASRDAGAPAPTNRPQPPGNSPPPFEGRRSPTGFALTRAHMAVGCGNSNAPLNYGFVAAQDSAP